jgi:hypothetical protein
MKKMIGVIAVVLVAVMVIAAGYFVIQNKNEGGTNIGDTVMTFNGSNYTWNQLEEDFGNKTVDGNVGISLSDIMNATAFGGLNFDIQNETLFSITAADWQKNVSWMDLQAGILMEIDFKTYFPNLPGAYKVKNVVSIDVVPLGPIMILKAGGTMSDNVEVTWSELSAELDEVSFTHNNQNYSGMELVDVFEYAGFTGLGNASFTFEGVDAYSKTVNYAEVQTGYLVVDGYKTVFENLSGGYKIKNIIRITVEY